MIDLVRQVAHSKTHNIIIKLPLYIFTLYIIVNPASTTAETKLLSSCAGYSECEVCLDKLVRLTEHASNNTALYQQ